MTQTIELNVNGARSVVTADPGTPLIYVLRNDLKLKGTRFGCGAGVCGCCTVLLDGRGIQSCNTPVSAAAGGEVTTIEGLGEGLGGKAAPHPLQQAFVDEQAGQCGYCLTGIIMGAAALLGRNPSPTEARDSFRAGRPSLPMRRLRPHPARDPTRERDDGQEGRVR